MSFHPSALYGADRQMFVCRTREQFDSLVAAGWKGCPLELESPYKPDEALWVEKWPDVKVEPARKKPGPKPKVAA